MPISSITTNDTFGLLVTRTSQLITAYNTLESNGAITSAVTAQTAFGAANSAFANGNTNFVVLQSAFGTANSGWLQANTARSHANAAFANANTTHTLTIDAFTQANTARDQANTAVAAAGPGFNAANAAFANGNTNFVVLQTVSGVANNGWLQANTARIHANSAFATANSANATTGVSPSTYGGDSTVPVITVDDRGKITSASNVSISLPTLYQNSIIFTSTTSWIVPTGVTEVLALVIGGGGGGGGAPGISNDVGYTDAANGGVGGVGMGLVSVTPGASISATIAAGGVGNNTATAVSTGNGGNSIFSTITAVGGGGGGTTLPGRTGYALSGATVNSSISNIESIPGTASLFGSFGSAARSNLTSIILNGKVFKTRPQALTSTAQLTFTVAGNNYPGAAGSGETLANNRSTGGVSGVIAIFWK